MPGRFTRSAFLSTLSLRRATGKCAVSSAMSNDFYPRSPCGERHILPLFWHLLFQFLSTLSLRRATRLLQGSAKQIFHFYPRSPCGERRGPRWTKCRHPLFLSTLSLRRATVKGPGIQVLFDISIHALLAESDLRTPPQDSRLLTFLSTLSLRRATCHTISENTCF